MVKSPLWRSPKQQERHHNKGRSRAAAFVVSVPGEQMPGRPKRRLRPTTGPLCCTKLPSPAGLPVTGWRFSRSSGYGSCPASVRSGHRYGALAKDATGAKSSVHLTESGHPTAWRIMFNAADNTKVSEAQRASFANSTVYVTSRGFVPRRSPQLLPFAATAKFWTQGSHTVRT